MGCDKTHVGITVGYIEHREYSINSTYSCLLKKRLQKYLWLAYNSEILLVPAVYSRFTPCISLSLAVNPHFIPTCVLSHPMGYKCKIPLAVSTDTTGFHKLLQ
jgi:hypothetical protein